MATIMVIKICPFYSPGPQRGYIGGSRPMLPCVTLCPLITVKIPALKGLKTWLVNLIFRNDFSPFNLSLFLSKKKKNESSGQPKINKCTNL